MNTRTAHVLPRLPKPSRMPYIRRSEPKPHKTQAMTIAAGFHCADGYVLCADSLMSHGSAGDIGSFGSYEQKVFWTDDDTDTRHAIMCGSGNDGYLLHPFSEAFFRRIARTNEEMEDAAKNTLDEFAEKLGTVPNLQLLIASAEPGPMLKTDGLIVSPARPVEVFGIGENSLVRFLIDTFHNPNSQPMEEVMALAAFIVAAAKKYCPQYCGGNTVIVGMSIWTSRPLPTTTQTIQEIENLFFASGKDRLASLLKESSKLIKLSF